MESDCEKASHSASLVSVLACPAYGSQSPESVGSQPVLCQE